MDNSNFNGEGLWIFALLILLFGGSGFGGFGGNSASTQEILFGQQFQNIDNKIDRIGNGIADSTFALNNSITSEGRNIQTQIADSTQQILGRLDSNRIAALENEVQSLRLSQAMCGVPKISPYMYNIQPNCGCNGNV